MAGEYTSHLDGNKKPPKVGGFKYLIRYSGWGCTKGQTEPGNNKNTLRTGEQQCIGGQLPTVGVRLRMGGPGDRKRLNFGPYSSLPGQNCIATD